MSLILGLAGLAPQEMAWAMAESLTPNKNFSAASLGQCPGPPTDAQCV
jgi:hypothetical protein